MAHHRKFHLIEKSLRKEKFYSNLIQKTRIKKEWQPDITISRNPGSGGRPIAKKVAKKLNWKYYGKRIFKDIAKDMDIPEHIVKTIDEAPKSNFLVDFVLNFFDPEYISELEYLSHLKKIIKKVGQKEDVVFLGRGSNHILPRDQALHVRITAPLETRIQNTHKYEDKTLEEAKAQVEKVEKERNQFIKQYFGCDPNDPNHFDLVINTHDISLNAACDIIIEAFKRKFFRMKVEVKD